MQLPFHQPLPRFLSFFTHYHRKFVLLSELISQGQYLIYSSSVSALEVSRSSTQLKEVRWSCPKSKEGLSSWQKFPEVPKSRPQLRARTDLALLPVIKFRLK